MASQQEPSSEKQLATWSQTGLSRRGLLRMGLALPASLALLGCAGQTLNDIGRGPAAAAQELELTPSCDDNPQATLQQTEGPYFTRNSPERRSLLETGLGGTRLAMTGYVLSRQCQPVPGALLDFWQADDRGAYDNAGYRLRGHQYADETGRWELETIMPGLYPGRTRHIHVKVQGPNGPVLTTQLYFPDEPGNARDGIYRPALVMAMGDAETGKAATFNFVVNTAG